MTPKTNRAPSFLKTAGCKKQRSLLFKKRRGSLFFCNLLFSGPYFGPDFFSRSQTDPCLQNKNRLNEQLFLQNPFLGCPWSVWLGISTQFVLSTSNTNFCSRFLLHKINAISTKLFLNICSFFTNYY